MQRFSFESHLLFTGTFYLDDEQTQYAGTQERR